MSARISTRNVTNVVGGAVHVHVLPRTHESRVCPFSAGWSHATRRHIVIAHVKFCIPDSRDGRAPYLSIDGELFHMGERYGGGSLLERVFGHQGIKLTQRDFVLLLWLALEADRLGQKVLEVPCATIAGKPAWHPDWRQVRTGIARRFSGPIHVRERVVVWSPRASIEFTSRQRCGAYVSGSYARRTGTDTTRDELMAILFMIERLSERIRETLRQAATLPRTDVH